jgi:hypothetical protein
LKDDVKIYENLLQVYFPVGDIHNNLWSAEARKIFFNVGHIKWNAIAYHNAIVNNAEIVSTVHIVIIWIYVFILYT